MRKDLLASRYAKALCDAVPEGGLDEIREELLSFVQLMSESRELFNALNNETLEMEKRVSLLDTVLSRFNPSQVLYNFFHILLRRARIWLVELIAQYYDYEADRRLGRVRGELTVPIVVPDEYLRELEERLGELLSGRVILTQRHDSSLLGGFTVKVGDWLFDATLEAELLRIKSLIAGIREAGPPGSVGASKAE